jgi:hypothetical protein
MVRGWCEDGAGTVRGWCGDGGYEWRHGREKQGEKDAVLSRLSGISARVIIWLGPRGEFCRGGGEG